MNELPLETFQAFRAELSRLGVDGATKPHYIKWVRYCLDYESKYGDNQNRSLVIPGFIKKLASKGQSQGLRDQALTAVGIILSLLGPIDSLEINSVGGCLLRGMEVRKASGLERCTRAILSLDD